MTSLIQTIPAENRALCACDQGAFSPDMFLWPQVLEMEGRKDEATFQTTRGNREMKPHRSIRHG